MSVRIVAVGKKHESWVEEGIKRYQKRLRKPYDVEWILLAHSSLTEDRARQDESERILARINDSDYVVLLDERGENLSSPSLSQLCEQVIVGGQRLVCVIGGAYGVDERVGKRAQTIWSLSRLVFPHQLVRLMLVEQLYRSQEIARGGGYHHE